MFSGSFLRNLLMVVAILALAFPTGTSVSARESFTAIAFQDFGDDDGDGIPNELDPDDDNDGIVDQEDETPSTGDNTPGETDPVDTDTEEPVYTNPTTPVDTSSQQTSPVVVSSLPDTGIGTYSSQYGIFAVVTLILGAAWSIRRLPNTR